MCECDCVSVIVANDAGRSGAGGGGEKMTAQGGARARGTTVRGCADVCGCRAASGASRGGERGGIVEEGAAWKDPRAGKGHAVSRGGGERRGGGPFFLHGVGAWRRGANGVARAGVRGAESGASSSARGRSPWNNRGRIWAVFFSPLPTRCSSRSATGSPAHHLGENGATEDESGDV